MRLLYLIYEAANASLGTLLAERARNSGDFDVVLWSPYCLPNNEEIREKSTSLGCLFVSETSAKGGLADIHSIISPWIVAKPKAPINALEPCDPFSQRGLELLELLTPNQKLECAYAIDDSRRRRWFCEDVIARLGIDAIVMAEDNPERDSAMWISAAKNRGCRTVVISYGDLDIKEAFSFCSQSEAHIIPQNLVDGMRRLMPEWTAEVGDKVVSRLPYAQALARVLTDSSARNPWVVNSGRLDAIGIESPAMLDTYSKLGFAPDHLHVVGHPIKDLLHQNLLQRQRQFDPKLSTKPIVLVAVPPDQTTTRPTEFGGYASVQDAFLFPARDLLGAHILISLHPNSTETHRERLLGLGFNVGREPLAELLPQCDLYISSVSTTIKWALGCGIPVLNYDIYGYGYEQYRTSQAVRTVSNFEGYLAALLSWKDEWARSKWIEAAQLEASNWGPIDGQSSNRIMRLIWSDNT